MTRAHSIAQPRWRVQVFSPLGEVTHGAQFKSLALAEDYYTAIYIDKSVKRLEVRAAGASRFEVIRREVMSTRHEHESSPDADSAVCRGCKATP